MPRGPHFHRGHEREISKALQGWMGPHWLARGMSAAAIHEPVVNSAVGDLDRVSSIARGGRTLVSAADIFSDEAADDALETVRWKNARLLEQIDTSTKGASASGAIEESTAELLRPLLQQWVSDHMASVVLMTLKSDADDSTGPR